MREREKKEIGGGIVNNHLSIDMLQSTVKSDEGWDFLLRVD